MPSSKPNGVASKPPSGANKPTQTIPVPVPAIEHSICPAAPNVDAAYRLLSIAAVVVGLLAWTMGAASDRIIPPSSTLAGLTDLLLRSSLVMAVLSFALTAGCSYAVAIAGPHLLRQPAVAWLPPVALAVAALEVALALLFDYVEPIQRSSAASTIWAGVLAVTTLIPWVVIWPWLEIEPETPPRAATPAPGRGPGPGR